MRPRRVSAAEMTISDLGLVVAHSVRDRMSAKFILRKGETIRAEHLPALRELGERDLHLLAIDPGELHEVEAGARLAEAVSGSGIRIGGPVESQYTLFAEHRGLLRVDEAALYAVNDLDGVSVLTRYDHQTVDSGEELAGVKVTPLLMPRSIVERAEAICHEHPPLRVLSFRPRRIVALALDRVNPKVHERFREGLERKLTWFGSELVALYVADGSRGYVDLIRTALADEPDLIMAAGASSLDPLEPLFGALEALGARIVKHGVPVHPGSLFWMACVGPVPLLGLSSCEMFSHKTVLDLVLPRMMAGEEVRRGDLVRLGHGGMLGRDMAFRFPTYGESSRAAG